MKRSLRTQAVDFAAHTRRRWYLYLPVFAGESGNTFNKQWFDNTPYERGQHSAVRVYQGEFSVFMDGDSEIGQVVLG